MQSSAIHDPLEGTTPSQRLAAAAHAMRQARIKAGAVADTPIVCPSRLPASEIKQLPTPPAFNFDQWLARQAKINPLPKEPWFSIVGEIDPPAPKYPSVSSIIAACAKHYKVRRFDILSSRRTDNIVRPRQVGMYLCKMLTPRTYPEIGRRFGDRDHTTAIHAFRKIERLLLTDAALAGDVAAIMALLGAS